MQILSIGADMSVYKLVLLAAFFLLSESCLAGTLKINNELEQEVVVDVIKMQVDDDKVIGIKHTTVQPHKSLPPSSETSKPSTSNIHSFKSGSERMDITISVDGENGSTDSICMVETMPHTKLSIEVNTDNDGRIACFCSYVHTRTGEEVNSRVLYQ